MDSTGPQQLAPDAARSDPSFPGPCLVSLGSSQHGSQAHQEKKGASLRGKTWALSFPSLGPAGRHSRTCSLCTVSPKPHGGSVCTDWAPEKQKLQPSSCKMPLEGYAAACTHCVLKGYVCRAGCKGALLSMCVGTCLGGGMSEGWSLHAQVAR